MKMKESGEILKVGDQVCLKEGGKTYVDNLKSGYEEYMQTLLNATEVDNEIAKKVIDQFTALINGEICAICELKKVPTFPIAKSPFLNTNATLRHPNGEIMFTGIPIHFLQKAA